MIKLSHLHKYFNRGKQNEIHVINDISLELPESGMVVIFGRSGCGKTTLLNVLGGLDTYASGSLTLDGANMRTGADELRNRYIGYIFQNYNLQKEETNFENVAVALRLCGMTDEAEIERRVMAALTAVDMARYRYRTPDTLSGGQQQRIAIARAIVKNPAVILADEPTGNLDEANTLMIMDLLHALARDHLVVLVTHEANLVDHYCDRVIELSDGAVVGERINENANGMVTRGKNDIYLGELEKDTGETTGVSVEYYGEKPETPVRLRIIRREGQTFLQVETPGVRVLDAGSEMKVHEGVFNESRTAEEDAAAGKMNLSALTPFEGHDYGRLFRFRYSVKSGYRALFATRKRGKKMLLACMALFSMVAVIMTALLGTGIRDLLTVNGGCSDNVVYVRIADDTVANKLTDACGTTASGVRSVQYLSYLTSNQDVELKLDFFDTYDGTSYTETCTYLDGKLSEECDLLAGVAASPARGEIVLSQTIADKLLKTVNEDYIRDYGDLIEMEAESLSGASFSIVGVVKSNDPAVYFNNLDLACYQASMRGLNIGLASEQGMELKPGEACARLYTADQVVPTSVTICGKTYNVTKTICSYYVGGYYDWLRSRTEDKTVYDVYAWAEAQGYGDEELDTHIFTWVEQYFSQAETYYGLVKESDMNSIEAWAGAAGSLAAILLNEDMPADISPEIYYAAYLRKQATGSYPTLKEAAELTDYDSLYTDYKQDLALAETEYYEWYYREGYRSYKTLVEGTLLSDEDFLDVVTRWGDSEEESGYGDKGYHYLAVYTDDVEKTLAWIASEIGEIPDIEDGELPGIATPDTLRELRLRDNWTGILFSLIAMAVLLGVLCLCMFFIMRSALMSRVREVGIWRAIGVSKKNLCYRFFVESLVTATLTVAVGFFIVSGVMYAMFISNSLMASFVYYPVWLAGLLLAVLYAVSILCGTAPVLSLLSRTPSEILAKYDI